MSNDFEASVHNAQVMLSMSQPTTYKVYAKRFRTTSCASIPLTIVTFFAAMHFKRRSPCFLQPATTAKTFRIFYSPFHNDEEALLTVLRVLVDIDDVDNVLAAVGPPVEVDLAARLGIVLQHLERALHARLSVGGLHHLAGDAEAEHVVADGVVVGEGGALDGQRGPRGAYERHEHLVNRLEALPRPLGPLAEGHLASEGPLLCIVINDPSE